MRCSVATLDQMGVVVRSLLKYAQTKTRMSEEASYYLKLILSELITNGFQHGCGHAPVKVAVNIEDNAIVVTVDDGGRGLDRRKLGGCADVTSANGRGLMIVRGLCQSVELNEKGNRITACLSLS